MTAARSESGDPNVRLKPDATQYPRPRVGISSCLLGEEVRYDGGHKRDTFLTGTFGQFVEWVPVCPEVECGLGTPREAMRLVRQSGGIRLMTVKTAIDLTDQLQRFADTRVRELASAGLSGYVLKKNSPSCGLERVKVYDRHDVPDKSGRGLFAQALVARFPSLPIEEEGRLSDPRLRENFVERVFAYRRLRVLFDGRSRPAEAGRHRTWTVGTLVAFHTAHKLILMAHSARAYQRLGRLVADASQIARRDVESRYADEFMSALKIIATPKRHTNVLQHMAGYFKAVLDRESKEELLATIENYRRELVPLVVPLTLIRHYVRVHRVEYLAGQRYLEPHPKELMLRNHV